MEIGLGLGPGPGPVIKTAARKDAPWSEGCRQAVLCLKPRSQLQQTIQGVFGPWIRQLGSLPLSTGPPASLPANDEGSARISFDQPRPWPYP